MRVRARYRPVADHDEYVITEDDHYMPVGDAGEVWEELREGE